MTTLKVKRLTTTAGLPEYKTAGAAGMDLQADIFGRTTNPDLPLYSDSEGLYLHLMPGQTVAVPTGLVCEVPEGYEGQIRPRSGLALKEKITVMNAPGTLDSDYRGELKVIIFNASAEPKKLRQGQRIAQLVITAAPQVKVEEVNTLSDTERGSGGFGSTGV